MELKNVSSEPHNETLKSNTSMAIFKIKCPQCGVVFINFTRLDVDVSLKVYLKTFRMSFSAISKEHPSITVDGTANGPSPSSLYYKCLTANESLIYLSIISNGDVNTSKSRIDFGFELNTVQCLFWQTNTNAWQSSGCSVNPELSNLTRVHCQCNNLSFFSAKRYKSEYCVEGPEKSVVAPMQSVIWVCILFILMIFCVLMIWAWRRDKIDESSRKWIYLKDNDVEQPYYYTITIVTGSNPNANTTSHIALQIHGADCTTKNISLFERGRLLYERGSINTFMIEMTNYVGRIEMITLWHDCFGACPSWYCDAVIIRDIQRNEEWNFDVDRWLSLVLGRKEIIASVPLIAVNEYYNRKRLIRLHWRNSLQSSYSLFSICLRRSSSKLSKVERVCIGFASIVIGLMFNVLFLRYNLLYTHKIQLALSANILISAILGFFTTMVLRVLFAYFFFKSKIVHQNRQWTVMFKNERK